MTQFAKFTPEAAVAAVQGLAGVPAMLKLAASHTGMRYAAIAHVTSGSWTCCAAHDAIGLNIHPGARLDVHTTFCLEVATLQGPIAIDHASADGRYCHHPTPKLYGFESYVCVPIHLADGSFFGTFFALDPEPATVSRPEIVGMFQAYGELVGHMLDSHAEHEQTAAKLEDEHAVGVSREQFIAVVAHDLRNPLASIATAVELLGRYGEGPVERVAGRMKRSVERMAGLLDDLVDFARGRSGQQLPVAVEPVPDLANALSTVVEEMQEAHPHQAIDAQIDIPGVVHCDVVRMQQLLSNLLANAVAYGDSRQAIQVVARTDQGTATLCVTNQGNAIAPELMGKLFDPYWRADSAAAGASLGLGLHICNQIAKAHQGSVQVQSSPDTGTCFTVVWPLTP